VQRTVAIIGASSNRAKFGNKAVRAYARQGWIVYPVNPQAEQIEGLRCYPSIRNVPRPVDRVTVYLPPDLGADVLVDVAAVRPAEFYVNPGADGPELLARARELGLRPIRACSILAVGISPADFPDE
jgi:predicted CoA-binding protein